MCQFKSHTDHCSEPKIERLKHSQTSVYTRFSTIYTHGIYKSEYYVRNIVEAHCCIIREQKSLLSNSRNIDISTCGPMGRNALIYCMTFMLCELLKNLSVHYVRT